MPEVGSGVMEIRLHGDNQYRVFYVARLEEAVYVLHWKTDLDMAQQRYGALIEIRKAK